MAWSNKYQVAIVLLMLMGLSIRIFLSLDDFLHPWDERYHALVAKNMLNHPFLPTLIENPVLPVDYREWSGNHIWVHKPPLTLWLITLSYKVFGTTVFATRIPSMLISTGMIYLTYKIGAQLSSKKAGFIAAFFVAINGMIVELVSGRVATDHVDIVFAGSVLAAVFFALKYAQSKRQIFNLLTGLFIGFALLSKWLPGLIVLPVWLAFILNEKSFSWKEIIVNGLILCTTIFVVAAPWQFYIWSEFPVEAAWESEFNRRHIFEELEGQGNHFFYHFDVMRIVYGELIYIPIVWYIVRLVKEKVDRWTRVGILAWGLIPFFFFTFVATKMQAYTLFAAPALLIITGEFLVVILDRFKSTKYRLASVVLVVIMIALPIRFSVERVKPFQIESYEQDWNNDLKSFSKKHANAERLVVHNVSHPMELMFYLNCTAYEAKLDEAMIADLEIKGYQVIEFEN